MGAGPGDPELMTLKAKRLISEADVILFDKLLDPKVLVGVKAELVDVGKTQAAQASSRRHQSATH